MVEKKKKVSYGCTDYFRLEIFFSGLIKHVHEAQATLFSVGWCRGYLFFVRYDICFFPSFFFPPSFSLFLSHSILSYRINHWRIIFKLWLLFQYIDFRVGNNARRPSACQEADERSRVSSCVWACVAGRKMRKLDTNCSAFTRNHNDTWPERSIPCSAIPTCFTAHVSPKPHPRSHPFLHAMLIITDVVSESAIPPSTIKWVELDEVQKVPMSFTF